MAVDIASDSSASCITALKLVASHPTQRLLVNWVETSFVVNGEAVQAIPGFARRMTESLHQRPSVVPSGATLRETIHPVGQDCLLPLRFAGKVNEQETIELFATITLEGETTTAHWRLTRTGMGISEAAAMKLVIPPSVPAVQAVPPEPPFARPGEPEEGPEDGTLGRWIGGILGATFALAGVGGFCWGASVPYYYAENGWDQRYSGQYVCAGCIGLPVGILLGAVSAGGGLLADGFGNAKKRDERKRKEAEHRRQVATWEAYDDARAEYETAAAAWRAAKKNLAAYERRRQELSSPEGALK